jgi:hypothetical protein
MAILGHIKIGGKQKKKTKNGERILPVKFDHFVVTTTETDDLGYIRDDVLMQKLMVDQLNILISEHTETIFDEEGDPIKTIQTIPTEQIMEQHPVLRRIIVSLPFDNPEENLITSLAVYDKDGCRCRGDGETAEWVNARTGEVSKVPCPCNMLMARLNPDDDPDNRPEHEMKKHNMAPAPERGYTCKANGILRVMIAQAKTLGGIHQFRTTSLNSITQLMAAMYQIREITGGILSGVPMVLEVHPKKVSPGRNKKPQTVYVVTLTHRASINEFLRGVAELTAEREKMRKYIAAREIMELPPPGKENVYDQVRIGQEYYAPSVVDATGEEIATVDADELDEAPGEEATDKTENAEPAPKPQETKEEETAQETSEPESDSEASEPPQKESKSKSKKAKKETKSKATEETESDGESDEKPTSFPEVDIEPPEDADLSSATKDHRKDFFKAARKAGYDDNQIRVWLKELWNIESSAKLLTWQTTAMIEAVAGLK